jgi:hypothetical protein
VHPGRIARPRSAHRWISWLVPVSLLAVLLIAPSASRATHTCSDATDNSPDRPYKDPNRAYPFPYPGGGSTNLPECRLMVHGSQDVGAAGHNVTGYYVNGNFQVRGSEWGFRDSHGSIYAIIQKTTKGTWRVLTSSRVLIDETPGPVNFALQGRGCMATDALEASMALVQFKPFKLGPNGKRSDSPFGKNGRYVALHGFLPRSALPSDKVRHDVDRFDAGCGGTSLSVRESFAVASPSFDWGSDPPGSASTPSKHLYQGEDAAMKPGFSNNCNSDVGTTAYRNFNGYQSTVPILVQSPGVHGGGVIRAIVRAGETFKRVDSFNYSDPNVPKGKAYIASWVKGYVRSATTGRAFVGFLPRKTAGTTTRPC